MQVGVTLGQVEGGAAVAVADLARQAEAADELGFDSVWLMDHFWTERDGRRAGGHEPLIALAYAAARTERVALGVLVLCHAFRHAAQLAREASALADASGGRLILGLGAGWYDPEFEANGWPTTGKVARLEAALPAVRSLLAGERVTMHRDGLRLQDASVITTQPPPPLWLGALQPRMIELTARHADGWNTVWGGADTGWFEERLARFRQGLSATGREPTEVTVSAGIHCLPETGLPAGHYASGSPAELADVWRAYERAGCEHLVVNLAEMPFRLRDRAHLARAGEALRIYRES